MKKISFCLMAVVLAVLLLGAPGSASLSQFSGNWKNVDPAGGLTKLKIDVSGTKVSVQGWGKCGSSECDWMAVKAVAYAPDVDSNLEKEANALVAIWVFDFKETVMVIKPQGKQLKVETFDRFTDTSGRTSYASTYTLEKVEAPASQKLPAPVQVSPKSGFTSDKFPRTTNLVWRPVNGAASYTVEIDCFHCCQSGKWCNDVGKKWKVVPDLTDNKYTFDFVGKQKGRWRVWAVDSAGDAGTKSGWWEFEYTR